MTAIPVSRLNHAVLYVRDLDRAVEFYKPRVRLRGGLAHPQLRGVHARRPAPTTTTTSACSRSVRTRRDRRAARSACTTSPGRCRRSRTWPRPPEVLRDSGALGGASDHGVSKSLYGADPDGNEFEIMWRVPREQWGELETEAVIAPLDMDEEVRRHGTPAGGG